MTHNMPEIDLNKFDAGTDVWNYATGISTTRKGVNRLRASKPKVQDNGYTEYVWRMVAFSVSPVRAHQCMPVTADFAMKGLSFDERRAVTKYLDTIADEIVNSIPKSQWVGVHTWGRALGYI